MKALYLTSSDGPQYARLTEVEDPEPGLGEIKIRLRAAALNHRELWISRGLYPGMNLPTILGADGAGVAVAAGEGADDTLLGRDVVLYPALRWGDSEAYPGADFGLLGMPGPGTIGESICVPAANVFPMPAHLSHVQAAALPVAALTAFRALTVKAGLKAGDRLLITGIGGGVATFALLFAKAIGAQVYVTSGSDETLANARELGADGCFNYRDENWGKALRKQASGIDVAFDGAPGAAFPFYARALAMGGRVLIYGSTGGTAFSASAPDLFLRHMSFLGTAMGSPRDFGAMLDFVAAHRIEPVIDRVFALDRASEALLYLEEGHRFGKVIIDTGAGA